MRTIVITFTCVSLEFIDHTGHIQLRMPNPHLTRSIPWLVSPGLILALYTFRIAI